MTVTIGHARHDENGNIKNGKAGDQNGQEVAITNWYLHDKGWVLLRCTSSSKREKIATAMEKACKNNQIGYDQSQRDTLFNNVKDNGFDPSKTTKNVETDCSALVRVCIAYAFEKDITGNINTTAEPDALVNTGYFKKYTSSKYCKSSDYLKRGDILCTPTSGHTVVVLKDGSKVTSSTTSSTTSTSGKLTVDGDWGKNTTKKTQKVLAITIDGLIPNQPTSNKKYLANANTDSWKFKDSGYKGGSKLIKAIQKLVGSDDVDGWCGKATVKDIQKFLRKKGFYTGVASGKMNASTVKGWQKYINSRL